MLEFKIGAEELHAKGQVGVREIADWLNATGRASMSHSVYDLNPRTGDPYTHVRVALLDGTFERFDLFGQLIEEDGTFGNELFVESKFYGAASKQGSLYKEYLAVCYSAFAQASKAVHGPASMEFMWATTHPFSQTAWKDLTSESQIAEACADEDLQERLGGEAYDKDIGEALAERLWLAVIHSRSKELVMALELQKAVQNRLLELRAP